MINRIPATPIYCDDCGKEKMAELRDGKLVIIDRRHGRRHVAALPLSALARLAAKEAKENENDSEQIKEEESVG